MQEGEHGMTDQHSGAGESHHPFYLLPLSSRVAVDFTVCAHGFCFLKRAVVDLADRIREEPPAFVAYIPFAAVMGATIHFYHRFDGSLLSHQSPVVFHPAGAGSEPRRRIRLTAS